MADFATISASVVATLAVQSLYFLTIRLPPQLQKAISSRELLKSKEQASYEIGRNVGSELRKALDIYGEWRVHIETSLTREEGSLIDREYFVESLGKLTSSLGAIRGSASNHAMQYGNHPVQEVISLLDMVRSLSKAIVAFKEPSRHEMLSIVSDIALLESSISGRMLQAKHESDIMQAVFRAELDNLSAETADLMRRQSLSSLFVALVFGGCAFGLVAQGMKLAAEQRWIQVVCGIGAFLMVRYLMSRTIFRILSIGGDLNAFLSKPGT